MRRLSLILAITTALVAPAVAQPTAWTDPVALPSRGVEAVMRTASGPFRLKAVMVDNEATRVRGLAGRSLAEGETLIYDFGEQKPVRMWTRDDRVPLDMAFVGEDGIVAYMRHDLPPASETPIPSRVPVRYVFELAAGSLAKAGVAVGDAVEISGPERRRVRRDPPPEAVQAPATAPVATPTSTPDPVLAPEPVPEPEPLPVPEPVPIPEPVQR
jgi:hypothetical protein